MAVDVAVRNTGDRPGADVVGLYARAEGDRPRLLAFGRVEVAAGETAVVTVRAPWSGAVADLAVQRHAHDPGLRL